MTMRTLILAVAILGYSVSALAQTEAPKVTGAPKAPAVPKPVSKPYKPPAAPMGCKLVGTVKGTKLWAGDCTDAAELRGSPATSTDLPAAAAGAIPPGEKQ
jgi:hypothetical protein